MGRRVKVEWACLNCGKVEVVSGILAENGHLPEWWLEIYSRGHRSYFCSVGCAQEVLSNWKRSRLVERGE